MSWFSRRCAPGLLAASGVVLAIGCTEKNKMTSNTGQTGPVKSAATDEKKGEWPVPLTPSSRYAGQIIHESQAIGAEPAGRVIRDQADYDALVASLPKKRIQMKQPSPPSEDPLLKKPKIDFARQMLVVAIRRNMFHGPKITRVLLARGKELIVEILHASPEGIMAMASRADVGTYEAVVVPRADETPVFRVEKKTVSSGK